MLSKSPLYRGMHDLLSLLLFIIPTTFPIIPFVLNPGTTWITLETGNILQWRFYNNVSNISGSLARPARVSLILNILENKYFPGQLKNSSNNLPGCPCTSGCSLWNSSFFLSNSCWKCSNSSWYFSLSFWGISASGVGFKTLLEGRARVRFFSCSPPLLT